jgi:hypothetical protein
MTFKGKGDPGMSPAEICNRLGHPEAWNTTEECSVCGAPVQWVRVEVEEGRAYTYAHFGDEPLERGEWVRLPGNAVRQTEFAGKVLRRRTTLRRGRS